MIFTLSHAKDFCAESIGNGLCSTDPRVVEALNEVTMWMMNDDKLRKHTYQKLCVYTFMNLVPMPANVEGVLSIINCHTPRNVFGMMYEFMEGGPGLLDCCNNPCTKDLVDLGDGFPTFYPMPATLKVAAFSTETGDIGKEIRIRGFDDMHMEIDPSTPGEVIRIQRWQNGIEGDIDNDNLTMSTNSFTKISSVVKAETEGYVTLLAYNDGTVSSFNTGIRTRTNRIHYHVATLDADGDGVTNVVDDHSHTVTANVISTVSSSIVDSHTHDLNTAIFIISKYGPYETNPGYRRYKVIGTSSDLLETMTFLVKMRYVPLRDDTDVLPLQNLIALKWLCKAKRMYDEDDLDGGDQFRTRAEVELAKQTSAFELGNEKLIDVRVLGYGINEGNMI